MSEVLHPEPTHPEPTGRVVRIKQPQFKDVTYWGPDKYLDHSFDDIFDDAMKDRKRPKDFHPGWWVVIREFIKGTDESGIMMTELPFRYEGELEPQTYLPKMVEANPDPDAFENFYRGYRVYIAGKFRRFEVFDPEPELTSAVSQFHSDVMSFVALIKS